MMIFQKCCHGKYSGNLTIVSDDDLQNDTTDFQCLYIWVDSCTNLP